MRLRINYQTGEQESVYSKRCSVWYYVKLTINDLQ